MTDSPLSVVVRDRRINRILSQIRLAAHGGRPVTIPPKDVDYIRRSFHQALVLGESQLYELADQILDRFMPGQTLRRVLFVRGRCPKGVHEGVFEEQKDLPPRVEDLLAASDTLLAVRHSPPCPGCGTRSKVIASLVRHIPEDVSHSPIFFLQTRIKTSSNLCYKIADLVFDIDHMFRRDKVFNEFSQVIMDIYGIKVICREEGALRDMVNYLQSLKGAAVVEENDYTGENRKKSGFEAYKMVLNIRRQLIEVQLQTQMMYQTEQTSRSASHATYKERQMKDRRKLGKEYLQVYGALSQLFSTPEENLSEMTFVEIGFDRKGLDDEF